MSDPLRPVPLSDRLATTGTLLDELRAAPPLTQCITNTVVTGFTANVLLAIGAAPAMVDIVGEAGVFAGAASGVLINLGTPTPEQRAASLEAAQGAAAAGTPWVLDPVAIGILPVRTPLAHELASLRPTAIRGNASEILALAGSSAGGRGVDATDSTESAAPGAGAIARRCGAVVAVSGPVDYITDGHHFARVANGHPVLTQVTGGGCALGAVMAAFLGVSQTPAASALDAVVAANLVYTVAGEIAAERSRGPGSFAVAFLDALATVTASDIAERAHIEEGAR